MSELTKVRKSVIDPSQVIPDMAGQNGKVLSNNGSMPVWVIGRYIGEIVRVSTDTAPPGCFALDGSRIPNGKNDFKALAGSGSRFITFSGNDLILKDFGRGKGKGSGGRVIGNYESDAVRNIIGKIPGIVRQQNLGDATGAFTTTNRSTWAISNGNYQLSSEAILNISNVVPTATENRPKSLTELVCIYHGVI